jgi:hypothetical protein
MNGTEPEQSNDLRRDVDAPASAQAPNPQHGLMNVLAGLTEGAHAREWSEFLRSTYSLITSYTQAASAPAPAPAPPPARNLPGDGEGQ